MAAIGRCQTVAKAKAVRGIAILEAVLLFVVIAGALALLAGQAEALRGRLRQKLATEQLRILQEVLVVYYLNVGSFPPGQENLSAGQAWDALQASSAVRGTLAGWTAPAARQTQDPPIDAWGRAYRYLTLANDVSDLVVSNGNWPIFVSAGPDGDFGDLDPSAEADNCRTDALEYAAY